MEKPRRNTRRRKEAKEKEVRKAQRPPGHAMNSAEARERFLVFFEERGHTRVASSPVIPHGDPTILFTNAGMNQFKEVFLGRETRPYSRACSAQKCIRAGGKHNDLDNVGRTARHLTFFEMLGNFSFGDYFKEEAIAWAWELLTGPYGLDPDRLYATVYEEDEEARRIWHRKIGLPEEKIFGLGKKDNFWSMGEIGPCGPCSEILFDRGEAYSCGPNCGIGKCDCDRYFEVWNLVFMQYDQHPDGTISPLPKPSIDTGMGLERLLMVLNGVESVYETDLLLPIIQEVSELSGRPYDPGEAGTAHRVIADHVRSLTFALTDGAFPSNEGRGYVVRRILRRAARYGRMLGLGEPFLHKLVDLVVDIMGGAYRELKERKSAVKELILAEEERFGQTLDQGLEKFEEIRKECRREGRKIIKGEEIFLLHDTFGFPPDLVARMAEEAGLAVDMETYEACMARQRERSRVKAAFEDELSADLKLTDLPPTQFKGYETTSLESSVLASGALKGGRTVVVLAETPFYAEAGGQVGDTGAISGPSWRLIVEDTQRRGEHVLHIGRLESRNGAPKPGQQVRAEVDPRRRAATQRHHTATHLLHAALRTCLGPHVEQRGSLVAPERLRFDFTHFNPLSPQEIREIERLVNESIVANKPVEITFTTLEEARRLGAMALFGEKYGRTVRMVTVPGVSRELCGGTHVSRTGDIGVFRILSESSVAAGVRRIEAVCGPAALQVWYETEDMLNEAARILKTTPQNLVRRIEALQKELRELKQKKASTLEVAEQGEEKIGELTFRWQVFPEAGMEDLRRIWDRIRPRITSTVLALFGTAPGRANLLVCVSPDLRGTAGLHCGELARAGGRAMGAGGGGRPEMGQAGGKDPNAVKKAVRAMVEELQAKSTQGSARGARPHGKRP